MKAKDILLLTGVGVAAYALYKTLHAGAAVVSAVSTGFSNASSTTADWLEAIFPHGPSSFAWPSGSTIILGDGTEITPNLTSGAGQFTALDGSQQVQFYFGGKVYRTTSAVPDETNTFYAATPT